MTVGIEQMKEILDFLNSIEGAGYGGMASFEIARQYARDMVHGAAQAVPAPVAWRLTDGEGDYEYLTEEPSDQSRAWSRRYGREWEPLYASPVSSPPSEPAQRPVNSLSDEDLHFAMMCLFIKLNDDRPPIDTQLEALQELFNAATKDYREQIGSSVSSTIQLCPDWRTCKCKDGCAHSSTHQAGGK